MIERQYDVVQQDAIPSAGISPSIFGEVADTSITSTQGFGEEPSADHHRAGFEDARVRAMSTLRLVYLDDMGDRGWHSSVSGCKESDML